MTSFKSWHLYLLGAPRLETPDGRPLPLERKVAGLLAYLALEGPVRRATLAGLFWPEVTEGTARNNLAQTLRKLRVLTGEALVSGDAVLQLNPDVTTDLLVARNHLQDDQPEAFLHAGGELLAGLTWSELPEATAWLSAQRARLTGERSDAVRALAAAAETRGDLEASLKWAAQLLALDATAEDGHLKVMQAHYLRGDVQAAHAAYRTYEEMLRQELRVHPLAQAQEIARTLSRSGTPQATGTTPGPILPEPALLGREREWAALQEAWDAGQFIFLSGDSGVGKSRLARAFAASQGAYAVFAGRPGDAHVPFSANARRFRELLKERPDLPLEGWVRRETARILPELDATQASPVRTQEDWVRFLDAQGEFIRVGSEGLAVTVIDDLQFFDQASVEAGDHAMRTFGPLGRPGSLCRFIDCFRPAELTPAMTAAIRGGVEAGIARVIHLEPLSREAATTLIRDLGVEAAGARLADILDVAGGNPQFILETVRHLMTSPAEAAVTLPTTAGQVVERRLRPLSPGALLTLRAAAILNRDFDLDLIADVLRAPLLEVMTHWAELEAAELVHGTQFTHDMILENTRRSIPSSIARTLHRGAAKALAARPTPSARVAEHWRDGQQPNSAAVTYLKAAQEADHGGRWSESIDLLLEAAKAFEQAGAPDRQREALHAAVQVATRHGLSHAELQLQLGRTAAVS